MFNTQILLSWMGFIWSLLKSRGFCLICENVRLKSQEEVSEAVNSVLFSAELFSGGNCSCCMHEGKRGCPVRAVQGSWQPLCLGLALGFPWLLQTRKHAYNQRPQLDISSFFSNFKPAFWERVSTTCFLWQMICFSETAALLQVEEKINRNVHIFNV